MNVYVYLYIKGNLSLVVYHDVKSIVLVGGRYILSFGDNKKEDTVIGALNTLTVSAK